MCSVFDDHHKKYDTWYEENKFAYLSELEAVRQLLPKKGEGVEIGVGTGRFAGPLGIKVGIEPSRTMAAMAQERGIDVINGTAEENPLEDESFDYVLMATTICFVDDIAKTFREARRIIKRNGSIIVGFVDKDSSLGKTYQGEKEKSVFYREATFYSAQEVITLLESAGFADFTFTQTLFNPLSDICSIEPIRKGTGEGAFVVIAGIK